MRVKRDGCLALAAPIAPDHHQLIVQIECEEDRKDPKEANNGML